MKKSLYLYVFFRLLRNFPEMQVLVNFARFQLNKIFKKSKVGYYPVSLVISATKRCNFSCEFCFVETYMKDSPGNTGDLTEEEFLKILSTPYGKHALRVGFLGGEPFLNKNIFYYLEILHSQKKLTTVVTNSSLLKGVMLEKLLDSPLDVLGLSLYENNREDVKRVAIAIRDKKRFWMQTVVDATTLHKMEETILFALEIGCRELIFDNYYPITEDRVIKTIFSDNSKYKEIKLSLQKKYKMIKITWVPLINRSPNSPKKCNLPMSYAQLDNFGNIGPCCVRAPEKKYGNIFSAEGWNSKEITSLRESLTNPNIKAHDICKNCQCLSEDLYEV